MDATDSSTCRIRFGFEVALADGGRVRGEGFELRACRESVSDRELAVRTMRHLRLAGVRRIRIVGKHIMHRHQDRPIAPGDRHEGAGKDPQIRDGLITLLAWPVSRKPA
jgi:hypothetical protein